MSRFLLFATHDRWCDHARTLEVSERYGFSTAWTNRANAGFAGCVGVVDWAPAVSRPAGKQAPCLLAERRSVALASG